MSNYSSVRKALTLLSAFGEDATTGIGVSELSRRANLPKSTAYRLLSDLEKHAAVERAGTAYRIGALFHQLSTTKTSELHALLRDVLTPLLVKLYEETGQTVHLGVLRGAHVVYLNKLYGRLGVRSPSRIGGKAPTYCTAIGKALLAFSPQETEQVLSNPRQRWTENTITDHHALETELEMVRQNQLSYDHQEIMENLTCIAAPIFGATGQVLAALSISGQSGSFQPEKHVNVLRKVIFDASRAAATATRNL